MEPPPDPIPNQYFLLASLGKYASHQSVEIVQFRRKKFPQIKMSDWVRSPSNLEKKFRLIYFISFVGKGSNLF